MKWLEEIEKFIESEFTDSDWANHLIVDEHLTSFISGIQEKERAIFVNIFEKLNFSILEGEFVLNCSEFKILLKKIFDKVGNVQASLITDPRDSDFRFSNALKNENFLFSVKKALNYYERVADSINKQIANPHKTIVFDFSDTLEGTNKYFTNKADKLEQNLFELFSINLILCWRGFFLKNDKGAFSYLLQTKITLDTLKKEISIPNTNFDGIIEILNEICVFYQRKLIIRIQQDDSRFNEKYIFNQNEYDFSLIDHHQLKFELFKEWDNYCQNHFLSETNSERQTFLKRRAEELLRKNNWKPSSFSDLHSIIKYYKDLNPNLKNLEKLGEFFNEVPSNSYEAFAHNVSKSYLKNNILSFKINKSSLDDIDEIIDEYRLLQDDSSINNFFPFYKLCFFLKNYIERKTSNTDIDNQKLSQNLSNAKKALKKLKVCHEHFKKSLDWSRQHLFYSYQLPFEECRKLMKAGEGNNNTVDLNLFLTSTFSLSVDYKFYDSFSEDVQSFILNSGNELRILNNLHNLTNRLSKKEKEVEQELKDQSKKNIELLSVFTAILALIFGGISTAAGKSTFEEKFLTFISLFIVLFSFVTLIRTFISKERGLFEVIALFLVYIISLIVIICILSITVKFNI